MKYILSGCAHQTGHHRVLRVEPGDYTISYPLDRKRSGKSFTDIAPLFALLISDDARWITGDTVHVDGGSKR